MIRGYYFNGTKNRTHRPFIFVLFIVFWGWWGDQEKTKCVWHFFWNLLLQLLSTQEQKNEVFTILVHKMSFLFHKNMRNTYSTIHMIISIINLNFQIKNLELEHWEKYSYIMLIHHPQTLQCLFLLLEYNNKILNISEISIFSFIFT